MVSRSPSGSASRRSRRRWARSGRSFDNAMMESSRAGCGSSCWTAGAGRPGSSSPRRSNIGLWHNTRRRHAALGILTPSEIETAWAAAHDNRVAHTGLARTASTAVVDERSAAGLAGTCEGNLLIDHQHLLLNDNHATDFRNPTPAKPRQIILPDEAGELPRCAGPPRATCFGRAVARVAAGRPRPRGASWECRPPGCSRKAEQQDIRSRRGMSEIQRRQLG